MQFITEWCSEPLPPVTIAGPDPATKLLTHRNRRSGIGVVCISTAVGADFDKEDDHPRKSARTPFSVCLQAEDDSAGVADVAAEGDDDDAASVDEKTWATADVALGANSSKRSPLNAFSMPFRAFIKL